MYCCSPINVVLITLKGLVDVLRRELMVIKMALVISLIDIKYPGVRIVNFCLETHFGLWRCWHCHNGHRSSNGAANKTNLLSYSHTFINSLFCICRIFSQKSLWCVKFDNCCGCNASLDFVSIPQPFFTVTYHNCAGGKLSDMSIQLHPLLEEAMLYLQQS